MGTGAVHCNFVRPREELLNERRSRHGRWLDHSAPPGPVPFEGHTAFFFVFIFRYTHPSSVTALPPQLPRSPAMSKEIGMLAVVVLKAKNLHDRHSFYKQDPYAKVSLNGKPSKTQVDVKGGQHPEWDAEFRFPVYATINDASRQMEVACWRAESKDDEEIGKGKVDISDTLRTGEFDGECESFSVLWVCRSVLGTDTTYFSPISMQL